MLFLFKRRDREGASLGAETAKAAKPMKERRFAFLFKRGGR